MTRRVEFQATGIPATQGSKRAYVIPKTGKAAIVDDNKPAVRSWRSAVIEAAQAATDGPPLDGPVTVSVIFRFDRPASHWGTGRNRRRLRPAAPAVPYGAGKMDLDKLLRALLDAMTLARVFYDDGQVAEITAVKVFLSGRDEPPGAQVTVAEL